MAAVKGLVMFVSAAAAALLAVIVFQVLNPLWRPLPWVKDSTADLVVRNATIYTSDASIPFADAMAVRNGRIIRVGSSAAVQDLIGYRTHVLDLGGEVILPGFIDSHVHLLFGGLQMGCVELRVIRSQEDFVKRIKEAVQNKLPGDWILGGGWNNDVWGGDLPTSAWIDDITGENPVWLSRMDGHMGLANSLALKIAGITNSTVDPVGGTILRTTNGEPTGLLIDSAMKVVLSVIPEISIHEKRDALIMASKYALSKGVTTVVDMGRYFTGTTINQSWQDLSDVYRWANSAGKMMIRVCLFFPLQTWSRMVDLINENGRSLSQWIYLGGVKAFADGSLGSTSALFYEPYEGEPHNYGLQVTDFNWLLNATVESDKSGLQIAIHAIGDKANDMVLDLYDTITSINGARDRRSRIEHAQHLLPEAISRFGVQNVIASVQPDHLLDDAVSAEKKIGMSRAQKSSYLFLSLLTGGAKLSFGSDWPVADIDPLRSIKTAMSRKLPGEETAWIPSECVGLKDALNAYTIEAAYACFLENEVGSLSPGKYADFVVLPASWEELEMNIPSTISATYVNGIQVFP
ncbi:hypothetical protein AXF42_Ash009199 [Apostasia shenzhenica]|uniref:Amidohydrolase 3 domain-containing protein n=1 Tax=Apostasia shenzhenica TaxID=1088818 RepID=A0A2I0ADU0_9ASPA|nr:hypothetical protein AXF42_Ash009199 [Apostasia shenzhenica]